MPVTPHSAPVFVASIGRSGSTLVQRVLNTHPRLTVWGEHAGMAAHLAALHRSAVGDEAMAARIDSGHSQRHLVVGPLAEPDAFIPWVLPFDAAGLETAVRSFVTGLFTSGVPADIRWGFKEIRYDAAVWRFLRMLYPNSQFVLVVRDLKGFLLSRMRVWGSPDYDLASAAGREAASQRLQLWAERWVVRNEDLLDHAADGETDACVVELTSFGERADADPLFEFLRTSPPQPAAVGAVLATRTGEAEKFASTHWNVEQTELLSALIDDTISGFEGEAAVMGRVQAMRLGG